MNKKHLLWTKQKNAESICTKSLLFNDSKTKSKECHGNIKRKTTRTNSYRYCSGEEETKNKQNMVEWKISI